MDLYNELSKHMFVQEADTQAGGLEYVVRCPFCGDSEKDEEHRHFYISADEPHPCMCQRCSFASKTFNRYIMRELLNNKFSKELNHYCYNIEVKEKLSFSEADRIIATNIIKKRKEFNIFTEQSASNDLTLEYLSFRYGIEFTYNDLLKYKIIGDLNKFIELNNLGEKFNKLIKDNKWIYEHLCKNALGFISNDNTHISFRWIIKPNENSKRFYIFELFKIINNSKIYTIKSKVDLLKPIELIIAEGPTTTIGVHNHLYNREDDNRIFVGATGKYYKYTINRIIKSIGIINPLIKLYLDADTDMTSKKSPLMFTRYGVYKKLNIQMYMNSFKGEKDFGVEKQKILTKEVTF